MDAASVEECWRMLRQSGKSIGFESLAHVPAYSGVARAGRTGPTPTSGIAPTSS